MIPGSCVVPVISGVNRGRKWIAGSSVHGCWIGSYETERQKSIDATIREGMTVWDVGANVGFYTLAFSSRVGAKGLVVAIEPLGSNVAILQKHIEINDLRNVMVIQAAVSREVGLASFSVGESNSVGKIITSEGNYKIPTLPLDLVAQSLGPPDLVKLDIEGAEAAALQGAEDMLSTTKPELWIALHGLPAAEGVHQTLAAYGYKSYDVSGSRLAYPYPTDEIVARAN